LEIRALEELSLYKEWAFSLALLSQLPPSTPATAISKPDPDQLPYFAMHAKSIIALALGATAVSAAAVPGLEVRQAGDLYRQFPESLDCPVKNGVHVLKKDLVEAVKNGKRDGPPYEASAANLATRHCGNSNFKGIPLWTVSYPSR
jgi:hypothetical protein